METGSLIANQPSVLHRLFSAGVPVLFIAIGYVDPGKWVASVEGGARFGYDLVILMLLFNFAAILCQYLSARIAVVTGRDLAQICSEEYDKVTCIFLGVQAELSMIALDLAMILGIAHGLNLVLGVDLFTCVFLTVVDTVLFPIVSTCLGNDKAKSLFIYMASFILICYVFGLLASQPEIPISVGGLLTKLSGESAFALMSLLGANIMPHNFYLHSSIVQQDQGSKNVSKGTLCHDHFFAILCIFSCIFLVNYVLMISAANVFYSTGLVLLTFQDALSLMDQVFRSLVGPFALIVILMLCHHITALTWERGGQVVMNNLFRLDIPGWLHHSTIRIIAIIPALYCVYNSGAEGIYQLLIFTQIVVGLLLPSSVIPLFRVASSRSIMGLHKISQLVEFLVLVTFIGMLGLEIIFVIEMMFGNSDWASNLRWNVGGSIPIPCVLLLIIASVTLCLMLWLAATPLKSTSSRLEAQAWNRDPQQTSFSEPSMEREEEDFSGTRYPLDEFKEMEKPVSALTKSLGSQPGVEVSTPDVNLPETLLDSDAGPHLTTIQENYPIACSIPSVCHPEEKTTMVEMGWGDHRTEVMEGEREKTAMVEMGWGDHRTEVMKEEREEAPRSAAALDEVSDGEPKNISTLKTEPTDLVEKTVRIEGDLQIEKDDDGDSWDPEESSKGVSMSSPSLTSDGPGSFRSLSGKSDDMSSGPASLSRLAGLGRAARRQLASILDEFWGQLFDFHGKSTPEAKTKKLDLLLGVDLRVDPNPTKADNIRMESTGYFPSVGGRGPDSLVSSLYDSPRQQRGQSGLESSYGVKMGSTSLLTSQTQLLDAYVRSSTRNALDAGERRYSSLRLPPSSDGYNDQPATIHGYQIASYINRMAKERNSDHLESQSQSQIESVAPKSPSLISSNYRDPFSNALGQKRQNGLSASITPPGFPSRTVARNNLLQSERPIYDTSSPGTTENVGSTVNTKKYHSSPDISRLSLPHREPSLSGRVSQLEGPTGYGSSMGPAMYGRSVYSRAPLVGFNNHPSSVQFNPSLNDIGSLWSRQPFEQFGLADKIKQSSITQESGSHVDLEAKLIQSFRYCIARLLKLEGSDWLFKQNDGADEDLIDRVAARERFFYEAETREINRTVQMVGSTQKNDDMDYTKFMVASVPHCGEGCIWKVDLIISFGVWCIHRVLELSLMESRPELWGKYTYVLNRLQGIIDPAFSKPRSPMTPCFCLQIPASQQQRSSPPISNGSFPPPAKQSHRGKSTTAATILDIIKDVEIAISCRKGRTGTAAGDVAFPKGKENLVSVLKRYKRRLSNKTVGGTHEGGPGSRKGITSNPYCS